MGEISQKPGETVSILKNVIRVSLSRKLWRLPCWNGYSTSV